MLPLAPANPLPPNVYDNCAMIADTKNKETPIGPRFAKTPAEGKMIIPSARLGSERLKSRKVYKPLTADAVKNVEQTTKQDRWDSG